MFYIIYNIIILYKYNNLIIKFNKIYLYENIIIYYLCYYFISLIQSILIIYRMLNSFDRSIIIIYFISL